MDISQKFFNEIDALLSSYRESIRKVFKDHDINLSVDQWMVIDCAGKEEGISQTTIAKRIHKEPAAVMRMLDALSDKHLVARIQTSEDRRKYKILLSADGRVLYEKCGQIVQELLKKSLSDFDFEQSKTLIHDLEQIRKSIHS